LPVFFNCSFGITLAQHLHKTHISDFFVRKQHVPCCLSMHTWHWTICLRCMLFQLLTALLWLHEDMHAFAYRLNFTATVTVTVANRRQALYYLCN